MTSFWLAAVFIAATFSQQQIQSGSKNEYAPEGGGFTIVFPDKPKKSEQTAKGPSGEVRVFTATYSDGDGNVFLVSYSDLPPEATKPDKLEALFEGVRDGAKGKDWTILEDENKDREFGPNKLPARIIVLARDKDKRRMKLRVILDGQRLYQIALSGSLELFDTEEAKSFMDSFKIIHK